MMPSPLFGSRVLATALFSTLHHVQAELRERQHADLSTDDIVKATAALLAETLAVLPDEQVVLRMAALHTAIWSGIKKAREPEPVN
jgi:dihydroxyacetone kinase-like predicted kinase